MLALAHTNGLELSLGRGEVIRSEPMALLLKSRPGVKAMDGDAAPELVEKLRSLPGWKTPGVEEVILSLGKSAN